MGDSNGAGERITGHVKWFDPGKGFGFVVSDAGGPDILLHGNVLRNFGQSTVVDGARVDVAIQRTPRGIQVTEIFRIDAPEGEGPVLADFAEYDSEELRAQPLHPVRVKWFDKAKGFGFANAFGNGADIFIHIEVLRRSGFADLQPGEALALRYIEGKRGLMATEICSWETATRDGEA